VVNGVIVNRGIIKAAEKVGTYEFKAIGASLDDYQWPASADRMMNTNVRENLDETARPRKQKRRF
jgi:formylmethanofuran:tetrahydromethanopterin formyltransferase